MNIWLATDLDDTWVKTARKIGKGVFVNVIRESAPYEPTFISAKNLAWMNALVKGGVSLIPVTGRSAESCAAWTLHGKPLWVSGGVYSHGADMADPEGKPVEEWVAHTDAVILANESALERWESTTRQIVDILAKDVLKIHPLVRKGKRFGWVIKAKTQEAEAVLTKFKSDFSATATQLGLTWFSQRNHLTVVPEGISKASALTFWKKRFSDVNDVWVGAGDAVKDGEFMTSCDWVLSPADSEWTNQ